MKEKHIQDRLQQIYEKIPAFPSCKHCHQCCGPILWFQPEEENIRNYLKKHHLSYQMWTLEEFMLHNMQCPYLSKNGCSIYPARPLICRLQGVIEDLPCRQNIQPALLKEQWMQIKNEFEDLLFQCSKKLVWYSTRNYLGSP